MKVTSYDRTAKQRYQNVLEWTESANFPSEYRERGITLCCDNPCGGILITGINPGYNPDFPNGVRYSFKETMTNPDLYQRSSYWRNKKEQIVGDDEFLLRNTAYLDLFPYAESDQKKFLSDLQQAKVSVQVRTLEVTQQIIENHIKPKLIIAANKETAFYWGIKDDCTWLGYQMEKEDVPVEGLEGLNIYRITGFRNEIDRVGQRNPTRLVGAYFIEYALYDDRHRAKYPEKLLSPDKVKDLFRIAIAPQIEEQKQSWLQRRTLIRPSEF